jgi:TonB family protein
MESSIVYSKTPLGVVELSGAHGTLPLQARQLLIMSDGQRSFDDLCELFGEDRASRTLSDLKSRGFVQLKAAAQSRQMVSAGGAPPTLAGERFRSGPPTIEQPLSDFPEVLEGMPNRQRANSRPHTQPSARAARPSVSAPTWSAPTLSSSHATPPAARKSGRSSLGKAVTALGFVGCAAIMLVGALRLWRAPDAPPPPVGRVVDESAPPAAPKPIVIQEPEVPASPPGNGLRAARPTVRAATNAGAAAPAPVVAGTAKPGTDASPRAAVAADLPAQTDAPASVSPIGVAPEPASTPGPQPAAAPPGTAPAAVAQTVTRPEAPGGPKTVAAEARIEIARASAPAPAVPSVQTQLPATVAASSLHVRNRVLPTISARVKRAGITQGSIEVILDVDPSGAVDRVELVNANPPRIFDAQMQDALQQWTFDPPGARARARIAFDFKP